MAKLEKSDVEHIAKLAKLELTSSEIDKFTKELGSVLDYVSQLKEVNTDNSEPTSQTTGLENVYRDDSVLEKCLTNEEATSGTENIVNGSFVVPGLLENK